MRQLTPWRNAAFAMAFLFFSLNLTAQTSRPDFNRASDFDVQHYIIRVSFDRPAKRVLGETTVSHSALKSVLHDLAHHYRKSVG